VGVAVCWAVTIEPFEVSRWRGGCGTVYGIWTGKCRERAVFFPEEWGKRRNGDRAGDESAVKTGGTVGSICEVRGGKRA
jgi:hypothetical protein